MFSKKEQKLVSGSFFLECLLAFFLSSMVALLALTWFHGQDAIGMGDQYHIVNMADYLRRITTGWDGSRNTGYMEFTLGHHLPFSLVYYPLSSFGLTSFSIERVWLFLSLLLPSFFMFLFLTQFLSRKVFFPIRWVTSLFYAINPFLILLPMGISITKYPVYLALPLLGYFLLRVFDASNWRLKCRYTLLLSLSTTLMLASFKNAAELFPAGFILTILFIFKLFQSRNKIRHILLFLCGVILSLLLNFWWFSSSFYSQYLFRNEFKKAVSHFTTSPKLADPVRLLGSWGLRSIHRAIYYYLYGPFYYSRRGIFLSYIIPFLCFVPLGFLVFGRKTLKADSRIKLLFLYIAVFLGLFFSKGVSPPFGEWFKYLYDNFAYFRIFRDSYAKTTLSLVFLYNILFCYSGWLILKWLHTRGRKSFFNLLIPALLGLTMVAVSFPIVTGDFVATHTNGGIKQYAIDVPDHWLDFHAFSKGADLQGRTLFLPKTGYFGDTYAWPSGFSGRSWDLFFEGDRISSKRLPPTNKGDDITAHLYDLAQNYVETGDASSITTLVNLMRILNVAHVVQQNEIDWRNLPYEDPSMWSVVNMEKLLTALGVFLEPRVTFGAYTDFYLESIEHFVGSPNIYRIAKDPGLEVYKKELLGKYAIEMYDLPKDLLISRVYVPDTLYGVSSSEAFLGVLSQGAILDETPAFLLEPDVSFKRNLGRDLVALTYNQLSEDVYKVSVSDVNVESFPLVFSDTFHQGWRLFKECPSKLFCRYPIKAEHFVANGYANGWWLNSKDFSTGFYIAHDSSFRLYRGLLVSGVTLLGCVLLLIKTFVSRKDLLNGKD